MTKLHTKGFALQLLNKAHDGLWDYEIAQRLMGEYGKSGAYWKGNIRLMLADLYSTGIVIRVEQSQDSKAFFGPRKVLHKYALSEFGKTRVIESGLA